MISVEEAKQIITDNVQALPSVKLSLMEAAGLITATDIYSPVDVPFFDQSAMDGYAFHFDSWKNNSLTISGELAAGVSTIETLAQGNAVRIFTGAPVPPGADTVVMQEKVVAENKLLNIQDELLQKGANVRLKGSEIAKGSLALESHTRLTPAAIGFVANMGIAAIEVYGKITVAIIVTGNELQKPGATLTLGQVYESNSFALKAALQQLHIHSVITFHASDDIVDVMNAVERASAQADIILMTGGVSVGDYDFVTQALANFGVEKLFHKIKQKPGKPLFFGKKENKIFFGLPGNPASVLTCFYEYVTLALSKLTSTFVPVLSTKMVELTEDVQKKAGLTFFLKGICTDKTVVSCGAQESFRMSSFAKSNCLVCLAENETVYKKGSLVEVHLLPI
ncbi:molybdopterin molybdotransferase MoeA [Pinibacter aurantiacus]|uniref:Molybdopterin molybdenumtransferase n=1 Tax=Pinibacter aurantiacus TaxID=2851599 RepID=A0A9E2W2A7_9BACT|nr:gephyrin-like molybdotransferase Glp [Pinibacter aurantiacus]MBV4355594.1 molybdopterin molybdotransferase MoeA [Pinibacter aurantiacus]